MDFDIAFLSNAQSRAEASSPPGEDYEDECTTLRR